MKWYVSNYVQKHKQKQTREHTSEHKNDSADRSTVYGIEARAKAIVRNGDTPNKSHGTWMNDHIPRHI